MNRIKLKKNYFFSLVEILIVLSLIALLASFVGIQAKKALREERFRSEVAEFVDRLRVAQELMMISGVDLHFKIEASEKEKGIKYWIETNVIFPEAFDRFLKKVKTLKVVHHVAHASSKGGLIDLQFLSRGSSMSSGNIQLSSAGRTKEELLVANIPLKGYPAPLFSTTKGLSENEELDDKSYMETLTHEIESLKIQRD